MPADPDEADPRARRKPRTTCPGRPPGLMPGGQTRSCVHTHPPIHVGATVQPQVLPVRVRTPESWARSNSSVIQLNCSGHASPAPSLLQSLLHTAPVSQGAPQTMPLSGAGAHTRTHLRLSTQNTGSQIWSDSLESSNLRKGAACFITVPSTTQNKLPPPSTGSLHWGAQPTSTPELGRQAAWQAPLCP